MLTCQWLFKILKFGPKCRIQSHTSGLDENKAGPVVSEGTKLHEIYKHLLLILTGYSITYWLNDWSEITDPGISFNADHIHYQ